MSTITNQACAACKFQRRKCSPDCPLAPYFPPDQPKQFLNVHRLFGVSNVLRILRQVDPSMKADTMKSIVYEADAWERDPVHGCLGVISILQNQLQKLQSELDHTRSQILLIEHSKQISNMQSLVNPSSITTINQSYVHPSLINSSQASHEDALAGAWIFPNYGQLGMEGSNMFDMNVASHDAGAHTSYDPFTVAHDHDVKIEVAGGAGATPLELHECVSHHGSNRGEYTNFQGTSLPSTSAPNINISKDDQEDLKMAAALFSLTGHE